MSKMLCRDYSDVYARRTHASRGVSSTSAPSRRSRSSDRSRAWIRDSRSHSLRSANRSPSRNSGSPLCRWTAAVSITENARSRSFFFMISPLPFRLLRCNHRRAHHDQVQPLHSFRWQLRDRLCNAFRLSAFLLGCHKYCPPLVVFSYPLCYTEKQKGLIK